MKSKKKRDSASQQKLFHAYVAVVICPSVQARKVFVRSDNLLFA